MRFARVAGHVVARDDTLELTVTLDTGRQIETVRSGSVPRLGGGGLTDDLNWQADQYTQETIGNELAEQGWEAIAEQPATERHPGMGVSATYTVRNLGGAAW
jgi:hypothetical protein